MKVKVRDSKEVDVELSASIFELADLYDATRRTGRRTKEQKDVLESLGDQVLEHPRVKEIIDARAEEEAKDGDAPKS